MADTVNRGYPKPVSTEFVSEDVFKLIQAFDMIDADIAAVLISLTEKAALHHSHEIADVLGLQAALDAKSDDGHTHTFDQIVGVSGTSAAPIGYVLYKSSVGWVPGSPGSVLGNHQHQIGDIVNLQDALDSKLTDAVLAAGALKATPVDADTLILMDSASSNARKRLSWAALKATLKGYFDGIYAPAGNGVLTGTMFAYTSAVVPPGYANANGQAVSRTGDTAALFALFGTTYGTGNGTTTFNLPNAPPAVGQMTIIKL